MEECEPGHPTVVSLVCKTVGSCHACHFEKYLHMPQLTTKTTTSSAVNVDLSAVSHTRIWSMVVGMSLVQNKICGVRTNTTVHDSHGSWMPRNKVYSQPPYGLLRATRFPICWNAMMRLYVGSCSNHICSNYGTRLLYLDQSCSKPACDYRCIKLPSPTGNNEDIKGAGSSQAS